MKTLSDIKQYSGKMRLFITLSIIWGLISFVISYYYAANNHDSPGFHFITFLNTFALFYLPVWLNWVVLWIYKEYKSQNKITLYQKRTIWGLLIVFLIFLAIYKMGFIIIVLIFSIPVWLTWLIYWVILGFKK